MFQSDSEPSIIDVVRSMKRTGFQYEEIYDILTGAGISSEETELFLTRIETDFEDAKFDTKKTRLGKEVENIFSTEIEKTKTELNSEINFLKKKTEDLKSEIQNLNERIKELQKLTLQQTGQNYGKINNLKKDMKM